MVHIFLQHNNIKSLFLRCGKSAPSYRELPKIAITFTADCRKRWSLNNANNNNNNNNAGLWQTWSKT
jgi:hypothetical protein